MLSIPSDLVPQLEKELRQGFQMNRVNAEVQAKQNARFNAIKHKSVEGLGQLKCRIPPDAYHFWGQKLGYDCWNDNQFLDEFLRDNPQCRVVSGGTKEISVGWVPSTTPRSRTVYK
jgi:hypothetical protein